MNPRAKKPAPAYGALIPQPDQISIEPTRRRAQVGDYQNVMGAVISSQNGAQTNPETNRASNTPSEKTGAGAASSVCQRKSEVFGRPSHMPSASKQGLAAASGSYDRRHAQPVIFQQRCCDICRVQIQPRTSQDPA